MRETTINCDTCGTDLRHTGYASESYLTLSASSKSNPHSMAYSMAIPADIKRTHDFCGLPCLGKWLADNHPDLLERFAKLTARRERIATTAAPNLPRLPPGE